MKLNQKEREISLGDYLRDSFYKFADLFGTGI